MPNDTPGTGLAPAATKRLGLGQRLGYGLGDTGFVVLWQGGALFLLYFYTDILGLGPWVAGLIYLAGMVWDAVSDPLIATWAERRAGREGGYARIIAWSALPAGLAYALMFTALPGGMLVTAGWALLTHLVFRTAFTCASMPYNALPARLTKDGDERSALAAVRVMFAAVGGLTAAIGTPLIVQALAGQGALIGYALAALSAGILASLVLFVCSRTVRSAPGLPDAPTDSAFLNDLGTLWTSTRKNTPLLRLLVIMLLATIGHGLFTQNLLYLVNHVLQRPDLIVPALVAPIGTLILAAPLWMMISARTSKKATLIAGLAVSGLGYLALGLVPSAQAMLALVAIGTVGIGSAAIPVAFWSMVPDVIDHGHLSQGVRVEARTFGLTTFIQKSAAGIAALLAGGLLAWGGYSPETVTAGASLSIRLMTSAIPVACTVLMIGVIWHYPLSRDRHADIIQRLDGSPT